MQVGPHIFSPIEHVYLQALRTQLNAQGTWQEAYRVRQEYGWQSRREPCRELKQSRIDGQAGVKCAPRNIGGAEQRTKQEKGHEPEELVPNHVQRGN